MTGKVLKVQMSNPTSPLLLCLRLGSGGKTGHFFKTFFSEIGCGIHSGQQASQPRESE